MCSLFFGIGCEVVNDGADPDPQAHGNGLERLVSQQRRDVRENLELVESRAPSRDESVTWLGVISHEDRWCGSLEVMLDTGIRAERLVAFEYPIAVRPQREAAGRLASARQQLTSMAESLADSAPVGKPIVHPLTINPYDLGALRALLQEACVAAEGTVVVDITCLTRAHTLALASWAVYADAHTRIYFAYTEPLHSGAGHHSSGTAGWPHTVFSPLQLDPYAYDASTECDGVVLLGHEGRRLDLALHQLTPSRALVLSWEARTQPEAYVVARTSNARFLTKVASGQLGLGSNVEEVRYADIRTIQKLVKTFCSTRQPASRLVLYPFGPKLAIMAAAISAVVCADNAVWYMYPVRSWSRVDYTRGIGSTRWLRLRRAGVSRPNSVQSTGDG